MANLNQSTVSAGAFPVSSHPRTKATWHRTAVILAAWIEIIVGASFLLVPSTQSQFVFGATPEAVGVLFARFVGFALIGLGIACLPSNVAATQRGAARSLLIYNIAATIFFAWVFLATPFHGVMLCPVVILHSVISITLALSLRY